MKKSSINIEDLTVRFNNCKRRKTMFDDYDNIIYSQNLNNSNLKKASERKNLDKSRLTEIPEDFETILNGLEKLKIEKRKERALLNNYAGNGGAGALATDNLNKSCLENSKSEFSYARLNTQIRNQINFKSAFKKNNLALQGGTQGNLGAGTNRSQKGGNNSLNNSFISSNNVSQKNKVSTSINNVSYEQSMGMGKLTTNSNNGKIILHHRFYRSKS